MDTSRANTGIPSLNLAMPRTNMGIQANRPRNPFKLPGLLVSISHALSHDPNWESLPQARKCRSDCRSLTGHRILVALAEVMGEKADAQNVNIQYELHQRIPTSTEQKRKAAFIHCLGGEVILLWWDDLKSWGPGATRRWTLPHR